MDRVEGLKRKRQGDRIKDDSVVCLEGLTLVSRRSVFRREDYVVREWYKGPPLTRDTERTPSPHRTVGTPDEKDHHLRSRVRKGCEHLCT